MCSRHPFGGNFCIEKLKKGGGNGPKWPIRFPPPPQPLEGVVSTCLNLDMYHVGKNQSNWHMFHKE